MLFKDRIDAGEQLANLLIKYRSAKNTILLALPRGGVKIAKPIQDRLSLPLDIIIPRKIGSPFNEELAIGAICEDQSLLNQSLIDELQVNENYISKKIEEEKLEAKRRESLYRKDKKKLIVKDKTLILIDDGIATGYTMEVSIKAIKNKKPKKIIIAVPILPRFKIEHFQNLVDELYYLYAPIDFAAIGQFYENFDQTSDLEVISILQK